MLHVTTEIGVPGKAERERRHYPKLFNQPCIPTEIHRGRRYISHGNGGEEVFKPHPQHICTEYTVNGPDWQSRLRWIPSPQPGDCKPDPEIWPESWKALRTFPWMSQRTRDEWMLYPEAEDVTLRCKWENIHKASGLSDRELSHTTLFGRGRKLPAIDKRNGIKQASPGDKSYQAAEYSPGFHRGGSTRPVVNFGGNMIVKPDTFVPLQEMPSIARESFYAKEKQRQLEEEAQEVHSLERWRPATPLIPPDGPSVIIEHGTSVHL